MVSPGKELDHAVGFYLFKIYQLNKKTKKKSFKFEKHIIELMDLQQGLQT